ncbi:sec-independent protein translocase protein TatB [Parafrankia irregularis]|uniref:Sec-independent protein translocase protein TatB n=1 Tax=Parafrankia irregularis TaxID=795642 RepID=A0A0S4QSQ4_9ACTN|nr:MULTISPECIES: Sec-independent protein translocase protein TatB [Parafrankia]MBE3205143.1 Sec-independent protein translocase protein TatB [Parafrankia sp. CH37]CUU58629.1 sec-independent protein translocase protein TatB [Parafrankia irregularis]
MFNGVGWGEVAVLLLIGLFVFGPDRLPKAARDAGRMLRQFRQMANGMRNDLRSELGPELADLDIRDLHPKTFVRKHLFEGEDDPFGYPAGKRTIDSLLGEDDAPAAPSLTKDRLPQAGSETSLTKPAPRPSLTKSSPAAGRPVATGTTPAVRSEPPADSAPFDSDAT